MEKILEYASIREKKFTESDYHGKKAIEILERVWQKISDEQHGYLSKESGMWKRLDVVNGAYYEDEINPLQF